jgi:hypothetical protein
MSHLGKDAKKSPAADLLLGRRDGAFEVDKLNRTIHQHQFQETEHVDTAPLGTAGRATRKVSFKVCFRVGVRMGACLNPCPHSNPFNTFFRLS